MNIILIKPRIQTAVVSHHRIDKHSRVHPPQQTDGLLHRIRYLRRSQIPGVNGVKLDALPLPVLRRRDNEIRQVPHRRIRKSGVGGQHRCRQNRDLHPHRGQNRQRDRLRAPPETGNILYGQNSFHAKTFTPHSAKSANAVLPNAEAGTPAPLLLFESSASAEPSNPFPCAALFAAFTSPASPSASQTRTPRSPDAPPACRCCQNASSPAIPVPSQRNRSRPSRPVSPPSRRTVPPRR